MPQDPSTFISSTWKEGIFNDRVVFCTGGAGTICSAQVRALVYLGANACIIGRNEEKTKSAATDIATVRPGAKVIGIGNIDVRSFDSLTAAVNTCISELGQIDYVIAGAAGNFLSPLSTLSSNAFRTVVEIDLLGSFNTLKATLPHLLTSAARNPNPSPATGGRIVFISPLSTLSSNAFRTVVEIDLLGSFNTLKATLPHLLTSAARNPNPSPATGGRIVFISATFHFTGMPFQSHVASAKAGVDALSASVALEYGPRGVTSNVISPGGIEGTEGMERLSSKAAREAGEIVKPIPLGRLGKVKEISDATVYLFSEAGNYVSGHVLVVDGAAWRLPGGLATMTGGKGYPEIVLGEDMVPKDAKSGRQAKL